MWCDLHTIHLSLGEVSWVRDQILRRQFLQQQLQCRSHSTRGKWTGDQQRNAVTKCQSSSLIISFSRPWDGQGNADLLSCCFYLFLLRNFWHAHCQAKDLTWDFALDMNGLFNALASFRLMFTKTHKRFAVKIPNFTTRDHYFLTSLSWLAQKTAPQQPHLQHKFSSIVCSFCWFEPTQDLNKFCFPFRDARLFSFRLL